MNWRGIPKIDEVKKELHLVEPHVMSIEEEPDHIEKKKVYCASLMLFCSECKNWECICNPRHLKIN